MIQNIGLFNTQQMSVTSLSASTKGVGTDYTSTMSSGIHQNYYNNTLREKDLMMIKNFSNQMSTLYGHASKLTNDRNTTPEQIEKNTKEFVDKFNETVDFLNENKGKNKTLNRLHESLTAIGETYNTSLSNIGITVGDDGKLSIDEAKFKEQLSSNMDKVKDTLSDVSNRTKAFAMRGMNTSAESLLEQSNNKLTNVLDEETYYAGIRKMASNAQFMQSYYSSQAAFSMINLLI